MRKSKLATPHLQQQVVTQLAAGKSQNKIAQDLGLNQSQISRFASRQEIRALIEQEQQKLVECVPDAVQNIKALVREMPMIPEDDTKRRELAYKASKEVLKSVGLLPSPVQSQILINIFHGTQTPRIHPVIIQAVGRYLDEENSAMENSAPNDET